jgi:hypothetical protein
MSESTSEGVECPICGEAFDPTAAGGWCTNPDCGEWQYLGEEVPDPAESEAPAEDDGAAAGEEDTTDADFEEASASEGPGDETAETAADAEAEDVEAAPATAEADTAEAAGEGNEAEADADGRLGDEERAAEAEEPIGDDAVGSVDEAAEDERAEDADEGTAAATCPDCGSSVDPGDNFCASCGADLRAGETLETCPGCGDEVEDGDSFCPNCGEDLEAARASLGGDDAVGDAGVSADDESPESLVVRARGEAVEIGDDQTLGREVRRILTETGGDEDDAVRIHREHVRFVREGGRFYLVDLGDNPTRLNDRQLAKGDREPVEPGDELELSGVVTLSVEAP